MTDTGNLERRISRWMEAEEAGTHYPDRLLFETFGQTRAQRQARSLRWSFQASRLVGSLAAAGATAIVLVVGIVGLNFVANQPDHATQSPPVELGIFEPAAGRIATGSLDGIWAVDPVGSAPAIKLTSRTGDPVEWTSDGTRLLIQKADGDLYLLHADGSETLVADQPPGVMEVLGSGRPTGETISPDGSRVVFAGQTTPPKSDCHDGALFAVDTDGGPAELLWKSQSHNGIVKGPSFSPDGTQIAFVDGYCDNDHSVWIMNADGSNAHQILTSSDTLIASQGDVFGSNLGGGHAYGLAWSPAGDRIALSYERNIFTFATDGSDVTLIRPGGTTGIFWSPDGSQIETRGPWHPGISAEPNPPASPAVE